MKSIEAITKKLGFWDVDGSRKFTSPFPGRYPTRWRILFHGKNHDYQVITKPNPFVIKSVTRVARHVRGVLEIQEFDRAGAFMATRVNTPRKGIGIQAFNRTVFSNYYPWNPFGSDFPFFNVWYTPVYQKLIKDCTKPKRKPFFVYSPFEVMWNAAGFPRLMEYRTWQNKLKLLK